jgi:hypothetical protein
MSVPTSQPVGLESAQDHLNSADLALLTFRTSDRDRRVAGQSAAEAILCCIEDLRRTYNSLLTELNGPPAAQLGDACPHGVHDDLCGPCAAANETRRVYGYSPKEGQNR